MAVLPRAQASSTPLGAADFASIHAEFDSCSGTPNALSALDRVLVRQNPWSAFDPEGLYNETTGWKETGWGWFADGLVNTAADLFLPDPVASNHAIADSAQRAGNINASAVDRISAGVESTADSVLGVADWLPVLGKVGKGVRGISKLAKAETKAIQKVEKTVQKTATTTAKDVAEANTKFRGGSHGEMKGPKGDGLDSHHMPADAASPIPREQGPAIQMEPKDHELTSSYGSGTDAAAYRKEIAEKIDQGKMRDAMAQEVKDVKRAAKEGSSDATKYNRAMQEMLDYAKREGFVPTKK